MRDPEIVGGRGILLENHVARQFDDTEAIYGYEGTNEINTLVVGRAITGFSASVWAGRVSRRGGPGAPALPWRDPTPTAAREDRYGAHR